MIIDCHYHLDPKLKPVETVIDGVFLAGTAQGPKNVVETLMSEVTRTSLPFANAAPERATPKPRMLME